MKLFLVILVLGLLGAWWLVEVRSRALPTRRTATGGVMLRYPVGWVWGCWGCLIFVVGMLTLLCLETPLATLKDFLSMLMSVAVGVGLGVMGVIETRGVRVLLEDSGITANTPWRGTRSIPWENIDKIDFHLQAQWFRVWGTDGVVLRISRPLEGIVELETLCKKHLDPHRYTGAIQAFTQIRERQ